LSIQELSSAPAARSASAKPRKRKPRKAVSLAVIVDRISERLMALEQIVHTTRPRRRPAILGDRRISKSELAEREGVSVRQIERRVKQKIYPPPEVVGGPGGRWSWLISALQAHERKRKRERKRQGQDMPTEPPRLRAARERRRAPEAVS
jgi:hypothetical protein